MILITIHWNPFTCSRKGFREIVYLQLILPSDWVLCWPMGYFSSPSPTPS